MTGANRPGDPSGASDEASEDAHHERHAESDDLRDSFDIDETAAHRPRHGSVPPPTPEPAPAQAVNMPAGTGTPDSGPETGPSVPEAGRRRRKQRRKAPWWELPALVALAIVIAILVKTFLVQPFYIPSQSMEKTLHGCPGCSGDRILVSKIVYDFRDPHPGDIVVFNAPPGGTTNRLSSRRATRCCGSSAASVSWSASCHRTASCS